MFYGLYHCKRGPARGQIDPSGYCALSRKRCGIRLPSIDYSITCSKGESCFLFGTMVSNLHTSRRNLELKARHGDLDAARKKVQAMAEVRAGGVENQVDTYFPVPHGRLK